MKKFIAVFILFSLTLATVITPSSSAKAQIVSKIPIAYADSLLTNADTAYVTLTFDGSFKSFEAMITEVGGVTGGKVWFQGLNLHTTASDWVDLDSLALTDVATAQYKLFNVPTVRIYKQYRLKAIKSGTGTATFKGWYLRYTGGAILRSDPYNGFASLNSIDRNKPGYLYINKQPVYAILSRREV
ncbi:MAG: hypothetical protein ABI675_19435 [Chitinophagaceae bacterium]